MSISDGKRPELVEGGLISSFGDWTTVKATIGAKERIKGGYRIFGDREFVKAVLKRCKQ